MHTLHSAAPQGLLLDVSVNMSAWHAAESDASDPVQAQNKQYKTEIASHQAQLEALKQQDPEFYEYLQQTDQELLNFGQDDDEEGDVEEQEEMATASEDEQVSYCILCNLPCDLCTLLLNLEVDHGLQHAHSKLQHAHLKATYCTCHHWINQQEL